MAICSECGCEFDISEARRVFGALYGAGTYNNWYPNNDVCPYCARSETDDFMEAGAEIAELMGDAWYDD